MKIFLYESKVTYQKLRCFAIPIQYIPNTPEDIAEMLNVVGFGSVREMLVAAGVPEKLLISSDALRLPAPLTEMELVSVMKGLADQNVNLETRLGFRGFGAYDHFSPAAMFQVMRSPAFWNAYTPYQPEVAQGKLQFNWEMQSMVSRLTGMEISNASHYDGANAMGAAAIMAHEITDGRNEILVSSAVHPAYLQVLRTFVRGKGITVTEVRLDNGTVDLNDLESKLTDKVAGFISQSPNVFGLFEDTSQATAQLVHNKGAVYIISSGEATSMGLVKPGDAGPDIVVGDGQALGLPVMYGGPYWGIITTKMDYIRDLPGRISGLAKDREGKRAWALILVTREQFAAREKASSNICTNQALCFLLSGAYLETVGEKGLREIGDRNIQGARYAQEQLLAAGCEPLFPGKPFYNEFALKLSRPITDVNASLRKNGIIGGIDLGKHYPQYANAQLFCVTETTATTEKIGRLVEAVRHG